MSTTQIRGTQIKLATIARDRIDAAFEASLAQIESNVTSIFNTMSTDVERMAAIDALTTAFQGADATLQGAITTLVNQTRIGAGLEADGSFVPGVTNYLGSAASIKAAVLALDAALKTEESARIAGDAALAASISTLVTDSGAAAAAALAAAVAAQAITDAAQDAALATEVAARIAGDATNATAIANEATARTNADTALSDAIAAEATARTAADSAEATARAAADTALQSNLDAEALARANSDATHTAAIAQEVTDRGLAVTAEATTRAAADAALDGRLIALEGGVASGITYDKVVVRETPAGAIDGTNVAFVLANIPYAGTETVFLNGLMLEPGAENDYVLDSPTKTLTLASAPLVGDRVKVSYFR